MVQYIIMLLGVTFLGFGIGVFVGAESENVKLIKSIIYSIQTPILFVTGYLIHQVYLLIK